MLDTEFFMGAYWGPRRESTGRCASRLDAMLSPFAACDPLMSTWFETTKARSFKQALTRPLEVGSPSRLAEVFNRGRAARDSDGSVMDDAGGVVGLWNGGDAGNKATINVICGAYSQWLGNAAGIELPQALCQPIHVATVARLLAAVAEAWEPDRAVVMSHGATKARAFSAKAPFVDWMLYLSDRLYPQITTLTPPATAQRAAGVGSIIIVQPEPPNPANAAHLGNIRRVETVLAEAGVLSVPDTPQDSAPQ
jgi:hypothetical protein